MFSPFSCGPEDRIPHVQVRWSVDDVEGVAQCTVELGSDDLVELAGPFGSGSANSTAMTLSREITQALG